jgi:hypothetical protein
VAKDFLIDEAAFKARCAMSIVLPSSMVGLAQYGVPWHICRGRDAASGAWHHPSMPQ